MLTTKNLTFRRDLQGLRTIAVLLVIFAHAKWMLFQGGFIGVDVFFVLSGYLITRLLINELEQQGRIAFLSFYARRLKRLLPALLLMLITIFMLTTWYLSEVEARAQLSSTIFASTWTSNFYFSYINVDYFDELTRRDMFLHTWSLSVEEQFYLIWPAILLMLFWVSKSYSNDKQQNTKIIFIGLALAFAASFMLSYYWTVQYPQAGFYLMPSRIWQFSLGAMVYVLFSDERMEQNRQSLYFKNRAAYFMLGIGLVLIIGSGIILHSELAYPGLWALLPSFGAAFVIIAGCHLSESQRNPLSHPVLVWIGDRSYSLYLWHWPIFMLGFSIGFEGQIMPTIVMMLLSMLAAILSFRLVEYPFWKGRWHYAKPRLVILISLLMMVAMVLVATQQLRQQPTTNASKDISNQWRADVPIIYRMSCDTWYRDAQIAPCFFGHETAQKTVVFLGDSIGAQWFSMLPALFPSPAWRIVVFTKSACAIVDEDYYYARIGKIYDVCTTWRNAVLDELDTLKPDVLIMGSASTYDLTPTQWVEGSARIFKRVSQAAESVFVISGTPTLGFDGPGCVLRNLSTDGIVDRAACAAKERMKLIAPVATWLNQAAHRFSNVSILDLNHLVCPDEECNAISKEGVVVFRDSQHLTNQFVMTQVPFIVEILNFNGLDSFNK